MGTVYLPFYGAATTGAPESYHSHKGTMARFSFDVAYWPFGIIDSFAEVNFQLIMGDVQARAKVVEAKARQAVFAWEAEADAAGSEQRALALLTNRSNALAKEVVAEWWSYAFSLFAKYGRKVVTYDDSDN